jgi:hypothetical protein
LPAIDGAALTGIVTGSLTLLGTLTTTSGTTQTLSGLTLTSYKQIFAVIENVSSNTATSTELKLNSVNGYTDSISIGVNTAGTTAWNGYVTIDLASGIVVSWVGHYPVGSTDANATSTSVKSGIQTTLTNASTSIIFAVGTDSFDSGTITVYGVQ